ncbi:MAG TPA: lanthionine synthetase LanC family protein [Planctomycetota bacterium]|nr:lanthionine synthetase LanC family protein [Planctomycetota bacterium]
MHLHRSLALTPFVVASFLAAQDAATPDALRDTVRGAVAWIAKQAVPVPGTDGAVLFPASEGDKRVPQTNVYGGSAGVMIFLENAAAVLDDAEARALADRAAAGLRSARRVDSRGHASWSKGSAMGVTGLYTGDAGTGQAFLVRHALRHDADALATAVEVGDALLARARDEDGTLSWGTQTDIIFGNAGTALFLLELGQASKQERFVQAARRAGHGLLLDAVQVPSEADPARKLPTWVLSMGRAQIHMPNFSHGTAGVSYALARIAAATADEALLQASKAGAEWLLEHAVVAGDGLKWAHSDRMPDVYMGGWCHGPAGTGRLFLLLHSITHEVRYLDAATKGATFIVDYAAAAEKEGGDGKKPYVPPSFCCGVAGVVDFFCDLERVTHDAAHAAFAKKAGQYLVDVAIADGDGRKWLNGQSVPSGAGSADSSGYNVDLMLGAAGEALALLRLLTIDRAEDPVRAMPDRAVTVPAPKK